MVGMYTYLTRYLRKYTQKHTLAWRRRIIFWTKQEVSPAAVQKRIISSSRDGRWRGKSFKAQKHSKLYYSSTLSWIRMMLRKQRNGKNKYTTGAVWYYLRRRSRQRGLYSLWKEEKQPMLHIINCAWHNLLLTVKNNGKKMTWDLHL